MLNQWVVHCVPMQRLYLQLELHRTNTQYQLLHYKPQRVRNAIMISGFEFKDTSYVWILRNTPLLQFVWYFYSCTSFQKSERYFFDKTSIDETKWSQCWNVTSSGRAEIKNVKIVVLSFSISALPPGGAFKIWLNFYHLWTLGQKSIVQIFNSSCINWFDSIHS